jgi:hypothetical protein
MDSLEAMEGKYWNGGRDVFIEQHNINGSFSSTQTMCFSCHTLGHAKSRALLRMFNLLFLFL